MINSNVECSTCGEEIQVPLTNFTSGMVCGNYWLQKKIGSGNVSEIFSAKKLSDNEKVYLKVLSPAVTLEHEYVERFMIEMCRSHQIDSPQVISVFETGKMNGHYYLATRFVEGECLDKRVERTGPMSEKEALKICLKIARILRTCWHDYGIVHQSIRPSNILVNEAGEVFLLDVGNSKQLLISPQVSIERLDNQGTLADFMSPEQAEGQIELDASSDIYSLGATLFYLLTGTKPYTGSDTTQVMLKHLNNPAPNPRRRSEDVSEDTARFIRAMMETRNPENRIYSWRDVVGRIKQLLKSRTYGSGTEATLQTQLQPAPDFEGEPAHAEASPKQGIPLPIIIFIVTGVILIIALFAGIAIVISNMEKGDDRSQEGVEGKPQPPKVHKFDDEVLRKNISTLLRAANRRPANIDEYQSRLKAMRKKTTEPSQVKMLDDAIQKMETKKKEIQNFMEGAPNSGTRRSNPDETVAANRSTANALAGRDAAQYPKGYRDLMIIGPFYAGTSETAKFFLPVDNNGLPKNVGKSVRNSKGKELAWAKPYAQEPAGKVKLDELYNSDDRNNAHAYAYLNVKAVDDKECDIRVTHDNSMAIWLNGRSIYRHSEHSPKERAQSVKFRSGDNHLLIRCWNQYGGWSFSFWVAERRSTKAATGLSFVY